MVVVGRRSRVARVGRRRWRQPGGRMRRSPGLWITCQGAEEVLIKVVVEKEEEEEVEEAMKEAAASSLTE